MVNELIEQFTKAHTELIKKLPLESVGLAMELEECFNELVDLLEKENT